MLFRYNYIILLFLVLLSCNSRVEKATELLKTQSRFIQNDVIKTEESGRDINTISHTLDSLIKDYANSTFDLQSDVLTGLEDSFLIGIELALEGDTIIVSIGIELNLWPLMNNGIVNFFESDGVGCIVMVPDLKDAFSLDNEQLRAFLEQRFPRQLDHNEGKVIEITPNGDTLTVEYMPIGYHAIYWHITMVNSKITQKIIDDYIYYNNDTIDYLSH